MVKEEFQTVKTVLQTDTGALSQDEWRKLVTRHFTHIEWQLHDSVTQTPSMPTPVLYMRLRRQRGFLGFTLRSLLSVDLAAGWNEIDKEVFLHTLGLALQGERYLAKQPKKMRYGRQLRGPKADPSSMRTLLKADIFATLLQYGAGDKNAVRRAARRRAEALLTARHGIEPGLFALPMACDTINAVLPTLASPAQSLDRYFFKETLSRADEIARCVDSSLLNDWYGFGRAAQDMAWRGASKRQILGAAFMAEPHMRTIAMMISDLTGLVGHTPDELTSVYSSFCEIDNNARAHEHAMEQEFEWALAQDPLVHGSKVFLQAADRQIAGLQTGDVMGWCADALHVSAKAFDDHGGRNKESLQAAREAFDESKQGSNWENLNRLGEIIVDRCRKGVLTGLRELSDIVAGQSGLQGVRNALDSQMLLANAPSSTHALEHSFKGPSVRGPQPTVEPVFAPSMPLFISVPVPAGPGGGTQMRRAKIIPPPKEAEEVAEQ